MTFRISARPAEPFAPLFALDDAAIAYVQIHFAAQGCHTARADRP